jgi:hypothetical protein
MVCLPRSVCTALTTENFNRAIAYAGIPIVTRWNVCGRTNPLQPDFSPVRIDASGAEHATLAISGLTHDRLQYDAGALHLLHLSCFFVNNFGDTLKDSIRLSAVGDQFGIPSHTPILTSGIQRPENLFV